MAPLLEDPRIRQTWNQFSQNAEHATENAAAGIWTFQHEYINPCFASVAAGFQHCTGQCFGDREDRVRKSRERGRTRGRAELSFDFYDDWDEDDFGRSGLLGWGNDELDRLLAGSGSHGGKTDQPKRKRGMSYGTSASRKKNLDPDPTVIPSTSALGFLGRLPFKFGGTLRYKPSAADLQDHPGALRSDIRDEEAEPLIPDEDEEGEEGDVKGHRRQRSSTTSSGATSDSFRSRGDLFPSDGEDDAVPLSDEFAMVLERRATTLDDRSSGKTKGSKGKRPAGFRRVSKTTALSKPRPPLEGRRTNSGTSIQTPDLSSPDMVETPSSPDLQYEERRVIMEEDEEVERKRHAAVKLAIRRGLQVQEFDNTPFEPNPNIFVTENLRDSVLPDEESREDRQNPVHIEGNGPNDEPNLFVPAKLPNFG